MCDSCQIESTNVKIGLVTCVASDNWMTYFQLEWPRFNRFNFTAWAVSSVQYTVQYTQGCT